LAGKPTGCNLVFRQGWRNPLAIPIGFLNQGLATRRSLADEAAGRHSGRARKLACLRFCLGLAGHQGNSGGLTGRCLPWQAYPCGGPWGAGSAHHRHRLPSGGNAGQRLSEDMRQAAPKERKIR